MDLPFVIKQRMKELGFEQKHLAEAAKVTESYISQILTRKKSPPSPERTDIYSRLEKLLQLPDGYLARLAELERSEELKRKLSDPPAPLFQEVRALVLRKCAPETTAEIRTVFEKQPFGELERLVTQKLLDVVKTLAKEELENERWLHEFARRSNRRYEDVRVGILEFLDTDVFHVSNENCVSFLEPLIDSWDIDFATFSIEIVLNRRLAARRPKRFQFVEHDAEASIEVKPGLEEFLNDPTLSEDVTEAEIQFLNSLRFNGARPTALYYYREIQSLRDPLHFRSPSAENGSRGKRKNRRSGGKPGGGDDPDD